MRQLRRSPTIGYLAVFVLAVVLVACGGPGNNNPPNPERGTVSGNISIGDFNSQVDSPAWQPYGNRDFRPGEIVVKFKQTLSAQALSNLRVEGRDLNLKRSLSLPQTYLFNVAGLSTASLRDDDTLAIARALNARADVLYAQPNYMSYKLQTNTPNDANYNLQWHYPAINLPEAWNITTGSPNVLVGVIDTGMMFDSTNASNTHPDFVGKVAGGYDFISDPSIAGDGDGRDSNGFDAINDNHGSHVGGTIAAATNNNTGVAGVGWNTQLLNVRVLGNGGGTTVDINEGSLWAAGIAVNGVPNNPTPAQVLNLSLGGEGVCSPFEQDTFDRIRQQGTIVVVAAGNENENANAKSPASCVGVITVGATGPTGERAVYSNFGTRIDVMAPGGNGGGQDVNNDGTPDGVLSTVRNNDGSFGYDWYDGTSMASPHVAGVVALMVAQKPGLTPDEALSVLRSTARPLSAQACNGTNRTDLNASDCGAGLIDAFAALQALGATPPPPPAGNVLQFTPEPLVFAAEQTQLQLSFSNTSNAAVNWQFLDFSEAGSNPSTVPANTLTTAAGATLQGNLAAGATAQIDLLLDRSQLNQAGTYAMNMRFSVGTAEQNLLVRFSIAAEPPVVDNLDGYMEIIAVGIDETAPDGFSEVGRQVNQNGFISNYQMDVEPSDFYLDAWYDTNKNGAFDAGDLAAFYPDDPEAFLSIDEGQQLNDINFQMWELNNVPESLSGRLQRLEQRRAK